MIKANAFIQTDTLILLASAISLTTFVYLSSGSQVDSFALEQQNGATQNRIANNNNISPVGKLVIAHNPADASAVLQQLESLNAINTTSTEPTAATNNNDTINPLEAAVADTTIVTTKQPAEQTVVATQPANKPTPSATATSSYPQPADYRSYANHRPYYGMPFPMPVYRMPPPVNPYRQQYGYAPYPNNR